jgi:hypothetical protein
MSELCSHPNLVHIINIEFGGEQSTTYRCERCNELLTVAIKSFVIEVSYTGPVDK